MAEYSDKELLDQFRDEQSRNYAFNLIVRKYQQKLYWHVRKIVIDHDDANDILQNTFIKSWKSLESFREEANLYTWLYRIATNESLTFLKQKRTRFFLPIADITDDLRASLNNDSNWSGDKIQKKLQEALLTLPDKQRIIFNMKYFDEMKYEEISEILGTSVGALKASYHIAVKKIENFLKED